MLFHTWTFAIFFAVVYPVYRLTKGTRLELPWLLAASYVFYGWWNPLYLILIAYGTIMDYWIVVRMEKSRRKKWWIALSVVSNLGLLGFFKYAGFVATNLNWLLAHLGIGYALPQPDILLPVGISFFTFQSMSYIIDCYRGHVKREHSFLRYAVYVSLFTQLVAGPIERASNLLRQLREEHRITREDVSDGLSLFVVGLFKKVALADYLALYVDKVYGAPGNFEAPALALATFAFAWQIYFDFSGYTDMARGIARMMGLRLMLNFNNPYLADSLGDFWQRWHISLSTWFKDYVYIPLGGNRGGTLLTYRNMVLTMVISGLWHGAAWTFLIWGVLHAAGRVLTRELERSRFYRERVPRPVKQLGVFAFVTFAWIFFRAQSVGDAWLIVSRIATPGRAIVTFVWTLAWTFLRSLSVGDAWRIATSSWTDSAFPLMALALVLAVWGYQFLYESKARTMLEWAPVRVSLAVVLVVYVATFPAGAAQKFIYFQF
jgi:D-alanyl-lipoteichoic acid acyltransferase DltB (MBOAT superfamily)